MEKKKYIFPGLALLAIVGVATALILGKKKPALKVAPHVDLDKYLGVWYEIARMPAPFEKSCYSTKAVYTKNKDGTINVENSCRIGSTKGRLKAAKGKAFVADKNTQAKLKVQFFWPFKGNYWILDVGENYEYALVGEPDRKYMWILSRTPYLEKAVREQLVQKAINRGFNTHRLIFTKHEESVSEKARNIQAT